jgi:AraC-like DNA-binding protein
VLNPELPYQRIIFWISQEYFHQLLEIHSDYGYIMNYVSSTKQYIHHYDIMDFNTIQSKAFELIDEIHFEHFGKEAKISLLVNGLILDINRTIYEQSNPDAPRASHSLYQNILAYIENHLEDELSLDLLAEEFYVSKYHIAHVFKENLGMSVHQYITKKRLEQCRDAIISNADIMEASLRCGFSDYTTFYRNYTALFGYSPKQTGNNRSPIP